MFHHPDEPAAFPRPLLDQYLIYPLRLCPSQTRICSICNRTLKPVGEIAAQPYDIVIESRQKRWIFTQAGEKILKEGNYYFYTSTMSVLWTAIHTFSDNVFRCLSISATLPLSLTLSVFSKK